MQLDFFWFRHNGNTSTLMIKTECDLRTSVSRRQKKLKKKYGCACAHGLLGRDSEVITIRGRQRRLSIKQVLGARDVSLD